MNLGDKLFGLLLVAAGGSIAAAEYLDMQRLYPVAAVAFGIAGCVGGFRALLTGRIVMGRQRISNPDKVERYGGTTARLVGVFLVVGGALIAVIGSVSAISPGGFESVQDTLINSRRAWGAILAFAGTLVAIMGVVRAKAGSGTRNNPYGETVEASFKGGGVLATIAGIAMVVVGAVLFVLN